MASSARKPHVCVIGAGVAGLRCADILLQEGYRVTILEGRNRIGGRLYQEQINGLNVDIGANWIHGTVNNPICDLAQETNTLTFSWDGRQTLFDQHGKQLSAEVGDKLSEDAWSIISDAMAYSNETSVSLPTKKSLYDYFEERSKDMYPRDGNALPGLSQENLLQVSRNWGNFVGSPVEKQSLKFFWLEQCLDGENLFVADTYQKILDHIAAPALKAADIRLNTIVEKITSRNEAGTTSIQIETSTNESLTFDQAVVTTPLGWLKNNKHAFSPALPPRITQAIDSIGYGTLDKIYVFYDHAWWESPIEPSTPNISSTSPQSTSPHYPGFTHWLSPLYAPHSNPSAHNIEAVSLSSLPFPHAHPTLLFYISGPLATQIASLSTPSAILAFLDPYISLLPNYSPSNAPTRVLHTNWISDPLAGFGSYCNFQTGAERADEDVAVLREGCVERGVWFAGEHTAPYVALGTVTGAWWAGEGVGRRIVRGYEGEGREEARI